MRATLRIFKEIAKVAPLDLRLSKYLARSGICSRRQADEYISQGKVTVNGKQSKIGLKVKLTDQIRVDGALIHPSIVKSSKLFLYRKPVGILCSRVSQKGEKTLAEELLKQGFSHLMKIGRLDLNSEGLLLLTNDGDLARNLEHPSTKIERKYLVKIFGQVTQTHLDKFSRGSYIDGIFYGEIAAKLVGSSRVSNRYSWISVTLFEGKNREIRKVFRHMGMYVSRLIRVSYGPYNLGKIQKNQVQEIEIHPDLLKLCSSHNIL